MGTSGQKIRLFYYTRYRDFGQLVFALRYENLQPRPRVLQGFCVCFAQPPLDQLLEHMAAQQGIPSQPSPAGVEVVRRGSPDNSITLVLNHNAQPVEYNGQTLLPFQCTILPTA